MLWAAICSGLYWAWQAGRLKYPYHLDLLALGGLALLNVGFFWQVLFDGAQMPNGGGDLASFLYPMYAFASQSLHAGHLPLWNPYLFSGMPFLADIQSGLFYPPNFLIERLARPFDYASMEWLAMLHYVLAGWFAYLLGRSLGVTRLGAVVGGLVWMWSGFMVAQLGHLNMVEVAVWLPLELLLLRQALLGNRLRLTLPLTAAVLAVAFFAGHTQLFLYELLALVLFVALWGHYRRSIPVLAIALAGAAALGAVQILPSLQLTTLSLRSGISYQESTQFALAPARLLTLLVPHFFGENAQNYWGSWTTTEVFGYAGILPLVLALAALRLRSRQDTRFWFWIGLLGVLLSLGSATVLQGWLYRFVPGFDKVRAPGRFLAFFDLGVAMLAGYGFDAVRQIRGRTRLTVQRLRLLTGGAFLVVAVAGLPAAYGILLTHQHDDAVIFHRLEVATSGATILALLLAASYGWLTLRRRWTASFAAMGIALVAVDLGSAGYNFNPGYTDATAAFSQPVAVVDFVRSHATAGARIDSATNVDDVFPPDLPLLDRVPSLWGLFNPVQLSDYYDYWKTYVPGRGSALYDALGARYVVAKKDTPLDAKFKPVFTDDKQMNVYEDPAAYPRAFAVANSAGGSHDQAVQTMRGSSFDPAHQAVLEGGPGIQGSGGPWPATNFAESGDGASFDVNVPQPAAVVVSTAYYPGWNAVVDGQPAQLFRADVAFQGLSLAAGQHHVDLRFDPALFKVGAVVSGLGWLSAGVLVLIA
ncbi:MAG: YfhO family protein, partial [Candidatus Eremiobacteraeota bacterium]|nr:YfhO family protein [Candidatus Eremiobacteraeota bacterium]